MARDDTTITYVLRCHSILTLPKLRTALFSVSAQRYSKSRALVAMQNLPDEDVLKIKEAVQLLRQATGLEISLENFSFRDLGDHRGALLNRALKKVQSRYVAFLDYDDVVYPHHAETLIADLVKCEDQRIAASFGGCMRAYYDDIGDDAIYITSKRFHKKRPSVSSCLIKNCFPIHCYVLDLSRMDFVPRFGESSHVFEDYIFLLELFENYPVSLRHARTALCEYRLNNDNSNTVSVKSRTAIDDPEKAQLWEKMEQSLEKYKMSRAFRIPYDEVIRFVNNDNIILSKQPFWRGLFICIAAKNIRKKYGVEQAAKFLENPKQYARNLQQKERSLLLRLFF